LDLRGPTSKGWEGSGREKGRGHKGERGEGKGEGGWNPFHYKFLAMPLLDK